MIIFWEIAETFLLNVRERGNKFQKIVLLRLFLWTHRIQFWQLCRKRFQKTPERFCPLSSKGIFLNKFFSSTCCNWHIDGSFEDLARIFSKVGRLIIAQCSKIKEKINFCKKKIIFPQIFSMDTWNAVLTTLLNFFWQKAGICFNRCLQRIGFSRKLLPWNWFHGNKEPTFENPCGKIRQKAEIFRSMSGSYKSSFFGKRFAFPLKGSYVPVEHSFDELLSNNARRSRNFSTQCPIIQNKFIQKNWFA